MSACYNFGRCVNRIINKISIFEYLFMENIKLLVRSITEFFQSKSSVIATYSISQVVLDKML